jgi:hypothetical protein
MAESGTDVLEATPARGFSWRAAALLTALMLLGLALYVGDQRARRSEERALDACTVRARTAVHRAYDPIAATWTYVRPVLDNGGRPALRRGMYGLLSRAAAGQCDAVADARDACAGAPVLPVHTALRDRRERCVRALDEHEAFLASAAQDGSVLTGPWPSGLGVC